MDTTSHAGALRLLVYLGISLAANLAVLPTNAHAQSTDSGASLPKEIDERIAGNYASVEALYKDVHSHPELAFEEVQTAKKLSKELRDLGFQVTEGVGKTGVVGLLRNGVGPTVMVRTELDALPIEEKTGLPFASKVTTQDATGATVPVAHACGHDLHMTGWYGTAKIMANRRGRCTKQPSRSNSALVSCSELSLASPNAMLRESRSITNRSNA